MQRAILLLFLGGVGLVTSGCVSCLDSAGTFGKQVEPPPPSVDIAAECKAQLAAGDYEMARDAAFKVVKGTLMAHEHESVDQAVFCYTTANTLYRINEVTKNIERQLGLVVGLLGSGGLTLSPQGIQKLADDYVNGRLDPQAAGAIGVFLDSYLGPVQSLLEENQELLEFIIGRNQFQYQIDALPLKIADKQLIDAGGRYDLGEIQLLYGLTRGLLGIIYMAQSQDYAISLEIVQYALQATGGTPMLALNDNPVRALSNAAAVLMTSSPKFLLLDANLGKEKMNAAGDGFAHAFDAVLKAINLMQKRPAEIQAEHVVEFKTANEQDYLVLHMTFENLVPLVELRKFEGVAIPLRGDVLRGLETAAKDLAGEQGVNTNLQRDVFPIVALATVVLVNSGAFEALIDLALDGADQATIDTVNKVLGLVADHPDLLLAALVGVVPVEIELDFGHVFKNPVGLRDVFPAWVYPDIPSTSRDAAYYQAFTAASVVYSYECADASDPIVTGDLLCASPVDGAHFKRLDGSPYVFWTGPGVTWSSPDVRWENHPPNNFGTLWDANTPTAKDGFPSRLPYLGWKDPTFGGLLYLDVTAINGSGLIESGDGLKKATLQSLNATLASLAVTLESFF